MHGLMLTFVKFYCDVEIDVLVHLLTLIMMWVLMFTEKVSARAVAVAATTTATAIAVQQQQ